MGVVKLYNVKDENLKKLKIYLAKIKDNGNRNKNK